MFIPKQELLWQMRSLAETLIGINSSGQSNNPSSPHYDDGITAWREGRYKDFPFKEGNINKLLHKDFDIVA